MPEATIEAPELTGTESLMADALAMPEATPAEPKAPETPATPEKPAAPAKPEAKAPEKPAAPAKPDPKAKPEKEDMNSLRQNYTKVKTEYEGYQKTTAQKIADLEARVKSAEDLGTKKGDEKAAALEKRIAELQKSLSETAYEKSEEYKGKYVEPYNRHFTAAAEMVKGMRVIVSVSEEGTPTTREGTVQDWQRVFRADPSEQGELATKLFGAANAVRVISKLDQLNNISEEARSAIENHKSSLEAKAKETEQQNRTAEEAYTRTHESATQELQKAYPQFFGEDEKDPEATAALKRGFETVDKWMKEAESLPPEDRAQRAAVLRAWAGAFPRLTKALEGRDAKIAALEAELVKFRGSDPGEVKDGQKDATKPSGEFDAEKGVASLAKEWEGMKL